jgi:hypothetical protein
MNIMLAIVGLSIKSKILCAVKRCMRIHISRRHFEDLAQLRSGIVTGWRVWRCRQRWMAVRGANVSRPGVGSGVSSRGQFGGDEPVSLDLESVCAFIMMPFGKDAIQLCGFAQLWSGAFLL